MGHPRLTMNSNILAPLALLLVASALLVSSAPASYPSSVDAVVPETGLISAKPAAKSALTRESYKLSSKPASKPASKPELTRKSVAVSSKLSSPEIIVTEAMCCKGLRKETVEGAIEMCNNVAKKEAFCSAFTPPTACEQCFQTFCVDNASKQSFKTQCAAITAAKKIKIDDKFEKVKEDANKMVRTKGNTRTHDKEVKEKATAASLTHSSNAVSYKPASKPALTRQS